MSHPFFNNHSGYSGMDPEDSRYYSSNSGGYPTTIEVDDDLELGYQDNYHNQHYPQPESYHGFPDHYLSPGSSITSSHPDNVWSRNESRGISSRTAPEEDFTPVPAGPRCIFHWEGCNFRACEHDPWVEHIYYKHFKPEDSARDPHRLYFGRTPPSWTCRFRNCGTVMRNDDHKALWDAKLAHLFGHFSLDRGRPEEVEEDVTWLRYYQQMGFLNEKDYWGGISAPPPQMPHIRPIMAFRRTPRGKTTERGYSEQDARGESALPFSQQMPPAQYQVQYVAPYSPPVQQYEYQSPMGPEQSPPPPPTSSQYYYGYQGTAQY